jgi:putative ABC transport system permease protein
MWTSVSVCCSRTKKEPQVYATVLLTLAVGIGANAAIFSVVSAVLVRRLPIRDAKNVVVLHDQFPTLNLPRTTVSVLQFRGFSQRTDLFQSTAALLTAGLAQINLEEHQSMIFFEGYDVRNI